MNYPDKSPNYFSNVRIDLIDFLGQKQNLKVLEIGAGYGETLFYLKEKGIAIETIGIELFEDKANKSNYKNIDRYIFGNINEIELTEYIDYFDLILLPDVLEHIFDPEITLDKMHALLKQDGNMVVSLPNIRHYSAFVKIYLKGNFQYEEDGLFDYTHVRFYCKKNMEDLFKRSNFEIIKTESSIRNFKGKSISKILNLLTFYTLEEFFTTQYFFRLVKK